MSEVLEKGKKAGIALAVLAIAFGVGYFARGRGEPVTAAEQPAAQKAAESAEAEPQMWTCSMHPQIRQPEPGQCPICGMDLIPVESGAEGGSANPREFSTSVAGKALMDIETAPVERRPVDVPVRMVGKVAPDERRIGHITAWVGGRIDRLYVDFTGTRVEAEEPMAYLYSPELLNAQQELLQALDAERELAGSDMPIMRDTAAATVEAAREKLRLLGLTRQQVAEIESRGEQRDHVTIHAPMGGVVIEKHVSEGMYVKTGTRIYTIADLSRVWVRLDAYESDIQWLAEGQEVAFTAEAFPGERFTGKIAFIDPVLDPRTRTVKVRLDVPNPEGRLKPDMFVRATARPVLGRSGEAPLVIPDTAPLITGRRAVVYVEVPDAEMPTFEGREVILGPRAGEYYVVTEGLEAGERVVTNGAFKIDSALQIQAKPSMMAAAGGPATPARGHESRDHAEGLPAADAPPATPEQAQPEPEPEVAAARADPAEFRRQLDRVWESYLSLQNALASDDFTAARKAVDHCREALSEVEMGLLGHEEHMAWMSILPELKEPLAAMSEVDSIGDARTEFKPFSEAMAETLRRFGLPDGGPVYRILCPMAFEGEGGHWLQADRDVRNPFYGASMLSCGEVVETIQTGRDAHGGEHGHE
ncbi:MAG: efflux RND transporter periplasmic adaptor subunit [Candidatus Brocadiia bacterium]